MRALAVELAPHRITCNAVSPGAIDTARAASAGPRPVENRPIPLKRFGTVEEIAAMVRLLVGPEGGWAETETKAALAHGATAVQYGSRILRTETAGIALAAAITAIKDW